MREIKKTLRLNKSDYYRIHMEFINCILPVKLTPREVEVLSAFMSLEGDLARYRFGPSAKKIVMNELKLSPAGLSNFMGALIDKGFLIKQGDLIEIFPILNPEKDEQVYMFKLINNDQSTITNGVVDTSNPINITTDANQIS